MKYDDCLTPAQAAVAPLPQEYLDSAKELGWDPEGTLIRRVFVNDCRNDQANAEDGPLVAFLRTIGKWPILSCEAEVSDASV